MINRLVDTIGNPSAPSEYIIARINQALELLGELVKSALALSEAVSPPAS